MTAEAQTRPRPLAILAVVIFPILGPALSALAPFVLLAVIGLLTLGLSSIQFSLAYFVVSLPSYYLTLAPPFLSAAILYVLGRRHLLLPPIVILGLAALIGFPATIGAWSWATRNFDVPGSLLHDFWAEPLGAILYLGPALLLCWLPIRRFR